ncbi:hypothetical protein E3N88_29450 [Mikania micrantha]|uniref:Integrase catalytic domain-containing protein n=1 Tax=Mikania micrantha TaxID=192012 RepID=A0A5N6MKY9_9ASTR|nr:hypothetical protein E3N88_29450 [Mikania micrantha]
MYSNSIPYLLQKKQIIVDHNLYVDQASSFRSESSRPLWTTKTPSSQVDGAAVFNKDRGVRTLSRTEWEERRKKGLCFRCGQQYGLVHKCPEGKLCVLLLGDDEYELSDGDNLRMKHLDLSEEPPGEGKALGTCLAVASNGVISPCGGAKTLKFEGTINNIMVSLMVDSGATHNFISRRLVRALGLLVSLFEGLNITLGDEYSVFVNEQCLQLPIIIGSSLFLIDVLVFDMGNLDLIFGMAWLSLLGEVTYDRQHSWMQFTHAGNIVRLQGILLAQPSTAALQKWLGGLDYGDFSSAMFSLLTSALSMSQHQGLSLELHQRADVFEEPTGLPPARSHDHSIQLTSEIPICVSPYRYPHIQKTEIERQVKDLLNLGMIRASKSAYSSPVILVRKKDNSWPMCVDYCALNKATVPDKYPIPVVEELIDELYGPTWEDHLTDLQLVFDILSKHQFKVNSTKCSSGQTSVDYLGHVINGFEVSTDQKKVEAALVTGPVLVLPNFSQQFVIECDASGRGIGAVLMQQNKPIAYFSKSLSDRNLAKSAYEREIMALALAVQLGVHIYWNRAANALSLRAELGEFSQLVTSPIWLQRAQLLEEAKQDSDAKQDLDIQQLIMKVWLYPSKFPGYSLQQGILHYQNRVVISRNSKFIPLLLHEFHTTPSGGHSRFYRTYRCLAANLYWPGMTAAAKKFVRECDVCQRCKASSTVPGGLLQPLDIPKAIWEDLSMDFIVGLLTSKGFNVVLVVVNRLSKYAHFLLLKHPCTAKIVAGLFVKEIIRLHGIPKSIVSDRDPLFLSKFWQEIFRSMGTQLCISSAYHPESDGQTEVINCCLEAYLRCFAVNQPRNWANWIPWAEYWHNSNFQVTTGTTPFEAVYGRNAPSVLQYFPGELRVENVAQELRDRDEALRQLKVHLSNAQGSMKMQADKKRRDITFEVGEWVYAKLKPYRQVSVRSPIHQKLAAKFFGPFQILEKTGSVAYKLQLPPTSKIHPVFHVDLLKKAIKEPVDAVLLLDLETSAGEVLVPGSILATRRVKR